MHAGNRWEGRSRGVNDEMRPASGTHCEQRIDEAFSAGEAEHEGRQPDHGQAARNEKIRGFLVWPTFRKRQEQPRNSCWQCFGLTNQGGGGSRRVDSKLEAQRTEHRRGQISTFDAVGARLVVTRVLQGRKPAREATVRWSQGP